MGLLARRPRVLLVEDNPADADLLRIAFAEAGLPMELDHVERLEHALDRLQAGGIDAVLLDLGLPDSLGVSGVTRVRAAAPAVAVVVLTGSTGSTGPDAVGAGAQDYLSKNELDARRVGQALQYAIERQNQTERARALAAADAAAEAAHASAALLEAANARLTVALRAAHEANEREAAARAEAERRADELHALFTAMTDCVIVYGSTHRIESVNDAAAQFFGGDLRGLSPIEFAERVDLRGRDGRPLPPDRIPIARSLRGEVIIAERLRVRTPSGERSVLVSVSPLRSGNGGLGAIAVYRDVTEHERAEADRERLLEALRDADRRKDEFLAMLSHELRNPLAPIRNSIYILDRAAPGGEQAKRAHAVIDRQVHHLTRLVDDLLDITRITRGKIRLQRERLELGALVRGTAEDHRSVFVEAGVQLETIVPAHPVHVNGDPIRLAQVIGNILHNAAKFTPPGGRASLSVEARGDVAEIHVRDTGAGIAPEAVPHLFQPFVQADKTLDRSHGGLGLGLALVKGIVELHGGSVGVRSPGLGEGTEFVVSLPLDAAEAPRPGERVASAAAPDARRILVIEDDVDAADTLKEALELNDHAVTVANTGPAGLDAARRLRPDVVLCDIGLPGMSGYDIARAIRSDPLLRATRLIALSGYASPDDVERARAAGFDEHLAKPASFAELERALRDAIPARRVPG